MTGNEHQSGNESRFSLLGWFWPSALAAGRDGFLDGEEARQWRRDSNLEKPRVRMIHFILGLVALIVLNLVAPQSLFDTLKDRGLTDYLALPYIIYVLLMMWASLPRLSADSMERLRGLPGITPHTALWVLIMRMPSCKGTPVTFRGSILRILLVSLLLVLVAWVSFSILGMPTNALLMLPILAASIAFWYSVAIFDWVQRSIRPGRFLPFEWALVVALLVVLQALRDSESIVQPYIRMIEWDVQLWIYGFVIAVMTGLERWSVHSMRRFLAG